MGSTANNQRPSKDQRPSKNQRPSQAAQSIPVEPPAQDQAALSLEQLSAAFQGMLGGEDPYAPTDLPAPEEAPPEEQSDRHEVCEVAPRSILEAMLFVGTPDNQPLASRQVASLMRGVRPAEIDALVRELNGEYARRGCPYEIVEQASGYRLQLRAEFERLRERFFGRHRQAKLSQAAIEVLAAVAYHQPITAERVAKMRGATSGAVLSQLVRRQLLRLEHSTDSPRRWVYSTTDRFLELFHLKDLSELPKSSELEPPEGAPEQP